MGERKALILLSLSIILVLIIGYFGLNGLLKLTTTLSSLKRQTTSPSQDTGITPMVPKLFQTYIATNSSTLTINGLADPEVTVNLYKDGNVTDTTTANSDGTFNFDVLLVEGTNSFFAQAESPSNKRSGKSNTYTIIYSRKEPKLNLEGLKDGDTIKESPLKIVGVTDTGSTVTINDHLVIMGEAGSFTYYQPLQNGDNKITVIAADPAGNQTKKELTIKYQP